MDADKVFEHALEPAAPEPEPGDNTDDETGLILSQPVVGERSIDESDDEDMLDEGDDAYNDLDEQEQEQDDKAAVRAHAVPLQINWNIIIISVIFSHLCFIGLQFQQAGLSSYSRKRHFKNTDKGSTVGSWFRRRIDDMTPDALDIPETAEIQQVDYEQEALGDLRCARV